MSSKGGDPRIAIGAVIAITLCVVWSTYRNPIGDNPPTEDQPLWFSEELPAMVEARDKARERLQDFIDAVSNPQPNQSLFVIKSGFAYEGSTEYLWLGDVTYDDGAFTGTVENLPARTVVVEMGESLMVPAGDVVDWSYFEDGKMVGGYTIRVMRNLLPPDQQAKFDENIQFRDDERP